VPRAESVFTGTQAFIGEFSFAPDAPLCLVARPFIGDVVALDTGALRIKYVATLGQQPLQFAAFGGGAVVARDWKTARFSREHLTAVALLIGQLLKIASGVAQLGCALWLLARAPRTRVTLAFAIAFGVNGIAYAIFNFALPGARTLASWTVEWRGVFNWIAIVALVLFGIFVAREHRRRPSTWLIAIAVALIMLAPDVVEARRRGVELLAFGGTAIYSATAFVLALFPLLFALNSETEVRSLCGVVGAALSINSVDHLGAEMIQPGPIGPAHAAIRVGAMAIVLALWIWTSRGVPAEDARLVRLVIVWMIVPFVAGVVVRLATESYRGVQEVGFIGAGRFAACGVLIYGIVTRRLFGR
jgi:hypothetical protein